MILRLQNQIGSGAFGDIVSGDNQRVYKIFRLITDIELAHAQPFIFQAETSAYEIVSKSTELQRHAPLYYGPTRISAVISESGEDVTPEYWPDLCFGMERLPRDPHERKFGSFFETRSWPRMQVIERLFEEAGIMHLGDASVLQWRRKYPKLIDFGTFDAASTHLRPAPRAT